MDTPLDRLKAALRSLTPEHEAIARDVMKWTPAPRPAGQMYGEGSRPPQALDGSDFDQHEPGHAERKRVEARRRLANAEGVAGSTVARLAQEAAAGPAARFQQGTKLGPEARSEVPLLLEEFRGRTRQEQAELVRRGLAAANSGDLQTALAVRRAAQALNVESGELDAALVKADPERRAASTEIATIERLVTAWRGDVARRRVRAGVAQDGDTVLAAGFATEHGYARNEDGAPFVEQALSQPVKE